MDQLSQQQQLRQRQQLLTVSSSLHEPVHAAVNEDEDDEDIVCLTPERSVFGRPRIYRKTIAEIERETSLIAEDGCGSNYIEDEAAAEDLLTSDKLCKAEVTFTPDPSKWMYCPWRDCHFWTRKSDRMAKHKQCHLPGINLFRCCDCGEKFHSLQKLLKHDRIAHGGPAEYECKICETEVTEIASHMKVCTIQNVY